MPETTVSRVDVGMIHRNHVTIMTWIKLAIFLIYMAFYKLMMKFMLIFPPLYKSTLEKISYKTHMNITGMSLDDWGPSITSWQSYKSLCKSTLQDLQCRVSQGSEAVDADIMKLDGTSGKLLDFMRSDRPLVVNFGSCT